jgi:cell division protein FtsQ
LTTTQTLDRPEASPIDPRLRARRISVRRDEARKRLHRLIAMGVAVALMVTAFLVTRSPLLDVDRVVVTGTTHLTTEVVAAATGIRRHSPMTDVNLSRARAGALALPWVESVSVRREWPATVRVVVRERTAVAVVSAPQADGAAEVWALVDRAGRVLEAVPAAPPAMALLEGVSASSAPGSRLDATADDLLAVAAALAPPLAAHVASVARTDDGVELRLRERGVVRMGTADDLSAKLLAVATVLGQVELRGLCVVDVRVPLAPSLTRTGSCL